MPFNGAQPVRAGWGSWIAAAAFAILLFETASGFAVTFAGFHAAAQWTVLIHTAVGLLTIIPLVWYTIRHWLDYREQAMSDVKLLGYISAAALLVCCASGLVVTWQAIFGVRSTPFWRSTHLISTVAAIAAAAPHLVMAWLRRRGKQLAPEARAWLMRGTAAACAAAVPIVFLTSLYSGTAYTNEFPKDYHYLYGDQRPFAPSLARTATGGAYDARSLSGSDTCGSSGCHTQIYKEWQPSAHRYAAMDPIFLGIQNVMAKQNGPESTRYCGGCHDPISLFSGTKNIFVENLTSLAGYKEGVSCVACHAIQKTDIQGNANYTIAQPNEYLWQWASEGSAGALARNFLIRAYPAEHNRLSRRMFKKPEYCAACHKQFIDAEVNRVGWVQLQNQYDNWAASHWNKKGHARTTVECRECHMPLVDSTDPASGDTMDYNRNSADRKHRSHRFLAANNFTPTLLNLEGAEEHVRLTNQWLQGKIEIPEIREKWAGGPVVRIRLEAPEQVAPGERFKIRAILASNKVGHDYPTGPLDMIQSWVEMRVTDPAGQVIFASGRRDEKNFIEPGTFLFKAEPVDQYGNLIDRHNLWEMVGVRYRRALFPGYSDTVEYQVACPPAAKSGELQIAATLHYRKIDQFLLNYVLGEDKGVTAPVAQISEASAAVRIGGAR